MQCLIFEISMFDPRVIVLTCVRKFLLKEDILILVLYNSYLVLRKSYFLEQVLVELTEAYPSSYVLKE